MATVDDRGVADDMIERRKEKTTPTRCTIWYLPRGVREERRSAITAAAAASAARAACAQVTCDILVPRWRRSGTGRLTGAPRRRFNGLRPDSRA
jgi:hypothetical protein